jgi:hypothetical protein
MDRSTANITSSLTMRSPTGDLVLAPTADGSMSLFSEDFGEWFHSRAGAYTEAYTTYIDATGLAWLAQSPRINILDVC